MNIRCSFCQTPFTIGRIEKLDALQHMDANNLSHYDVHCPRCRRATPVLRQKLEMTFPNWRDALKELEAEMKTHPQPEAPLPKPEADSALEAEPKSEHRTRAGKAVQATAQDKPAAEKPAKQKKAVQPNATAKKSK
jgi:phage FluMu protein Com